MAKKPAKTETIETVLLLSPLSQRLADNYQAVQASAMKVNGEELDDRTTWVIAALLCLLPGETTTSPAPKPAAKPKPPAKAKKPTKKELEADPALAALLE